MAHLNPKDIENFRQTQRAAESGQAKAQYSLGLMYANGVGVQQDFAQALRWYRKSADRGFAPAQYILAGKYANGQGVPRDIRLALSWYLRACEQGNSRALFKLGQMFSTPQEEFANQCFVEAAEKGVAEAQMIVAARAESGDESGKGRGNIWFQKAAEGGLPAAQYILGTRYQQGDGLEADLAKAITWYRKSARQGYAPAQSQLGMLYVEGQGVSRDYRQAISWLSKAAEQSDAAAMFQLGVLYEQGLGVAQNQATAEHFYMQAADHGDLRAQLCMARLAEIDRPMLALDMYRRADAQGSPEAAFALGRRYLEGEWVERDVELAQVYLRKAADHGVVEAMVVLAELLDAESLSMSSELYREAAEQGHERAQYVLGERLASGRGVPEDREESLFWLMLAAEKGVPEAQHAMAEACLAEDRGEETLKAAVDWYRKAAKQGFAKSQSALGGLYAAGIGVPKDNRQAASWWLKAAEQGDVDAQFNLGCLFERGGGASADRHAEQWYLRAIERGDRSRSTLALVKLHARKKSPTAELWYEQAAIQGLGLAQFLHGDALQRRADGALTEEGLKYYLKASAQGEGEALHRLAELIKSCPEEIEQCLLNLSSQSGSPQSKNDSGATLENGRDPLADDEALERSAVEGDPRAQWVLAEKFAKDAIAGGEGEAKAIHWYRQSALAGFPAAQATLAIRLATGRGVSANHKEAVRWWNKAADQGDAESQYNLALMYEKGQGVQQDYSRAADWLEKAARQGVVIAQTRLGLVYATGCMGEPDITEAYAWFALAASVGNEAAQANRDYAESKLSGQQLKEARRRADELLRDLNKRRT